MVGTQKTFVRKIKEALLALRLEQEHGKTDILRRYLDVAYFGHGLRGSQATAQTWFGVEAKDLTLGQAALLAAVLPSPAFYSPFDHPERAEKRRQIVLDVLEGYGRFTKEEIESARNEKLEPMRPAGEALVNTSHPWVLDTVRSELRRLAPEVDLLAGGFVIRTGINVELQVNAEKAVSRYLQKDGMPSAAVVVLDAQNGEIRAIVGGANRSKSEVNAALGAQGGGSGRQSGSSFKPIALAAALEDGWTLDDRIDAPAAISLPGREPAFNYDGLNWGKPTLRTATQWSINTAYMNLTEAVGVENVKRTARSLGLDPRAAGVEVAIGTDEVSPLALAAAYGAFADGGQWHTPHLIVEVQRNGELVWDPTIETRSALSKDVAVLIQGALRTVVNAGTGGRARIAGVEVSGKTGTTDNYADAWFTGWGEGLVGSVWVGYLEGRVPMKAVPGWGSVSGGSIPAQIWQDTMRNTLKQRASDRKALLGEDKKDNEQTSGGNSSEGNIDTDGSDVNNPGDGDGVDVDGGSPDTEEPTGSTPEGGDAGSTTPTEGVNPETPDTSSNTSEPVQNQASATNTPLS